MDTYQWKKNERFIRYNRTGIILDLFENTIKEGYWVKVLYDKTEYDVGPWVTIEQIKDLKSLKKDIVINI
jgi:hypothetical protein